ncbi:MAG TPA: hypothetical protein P5524_02430 [Candidatus Paceibacterota bacterium]|nr:hypothetical protein [Candidatus Paceibacterota bacterium]
MLVCLVIGVAGCVILTITANQPEKYDFLREVVTEVNGLSLFAGALSLGMYFFGNKR